MVDGRIDRLFEMISELREDVASLKAEVESLRSAVTRYNGNFNTQNQKLDDLEKLTYKIVGGVILASVVVPITVSVIVSLILG